jgi:hypothetical protein
MRTTRRLTSAMKVDHEVIVKSDCFNVLLPVERIQ